MALLGQEDWGRDPGERRRGPAVLVVYDGIEIFGGRAAGDGERRVTLLLLRGSSRSSRAISVARAAYRLISLRGRAGGLSTADCG